MQELVILGGGTAGTMAANKLRKEFGNALRITVVDRDDAHTYQPGYLFLPFGIYSPEQITRSRKAFLAKGIELVTGEIGRVDADGRKVHLEDGRTLGYDYLIIATGTHPRPDMTPGLSDNPEWGVSAHEFYSFEGAKKLAGALRQFKGGRLVVHISEMPIKCPVAPLELAFLADDWLRKQGLRDKTELVYVTPLDGAFTKPVASRELGTALSKRDIEVETDFQIEHVESGRKVMVSFDGREIAYDLLVTVPVNMGADFVARSGFGDELNYVPCDKSTMQAEVSERIFVLGDAGTLPTSKAGAVAHFSVEIFIENFKQVLAGKAMTHKFDGHANCFIESGHRKGMLLDFNYDTEPLTGTFPLPGVGPFTLLKDSWANHMGKLAFRWIYWNMLLPGRPIPIPAAMSMVGKRREKVAAGSPVARGGGAVTAPVPDFGGTQPKPVVPSFGDEQPPSSGTPIVPSF